MALVGGGLGFSFLAEAYANFGWFGLIPTVALMGYFMARLSVWGTSDDDPAKFALNATFLAFVLFFPRQESASFVRGLAWYSFLPYAAVSLIAERRSQRRRLVMNTAAA
jgi:oligosaccharide repeat unit polymerase